MGRWGGEMGKWGNGGLEKWQKGATKWRRICLAEKVETGIPTCDQTNFAAPIQNPSCLGIEQKGQEK